jgi:drug/metabolite transporter (DMT)-like permease
MRYDISCTQDFQEMLHKDQRERGDKMIQGWVLIALVSATGDAVRDLTAKRVLTKENSLLFTWLIFALPLPAIYTADYLVGMPQPLPGFYGALCTALPLEILAQILYMQALRLSPLSIVAPLLSLSPVFMLVVPLLLIGEKINLLAGTGVLLIASGAYVLNVGAMKRGVLEPFKALLRERGAVYMCVVALLFSFTATLSKKAIMLSSPLHYMAVYWTGIVVGMTPLLFFAYRGKWQKTFRDGAVRKSLLPALLFVTAVFAAAYAMSITKVTYVTTVKRLSVLFSIMLAGAVLKEESIRERFAGGVLMVTGFALIVLFG